MKSIARIWETAEFRTKNNTKNRQKKNTHTKKTKTKAKKRKKQTDLNSGTKIFLSRCFVVEFENYIWNEHPRIFQETKFHVKQNIFGVWNQKYFIWVFLGYNLKNSLSCLKSAPSNLSKCKV